MLTTSEIYEQLEAIPTATPHATYVETRANLEAQWREWLYQEFADDFSTQAADAIYVRAYEEGHSSGYQEIQNQFIDLTSLVRQVRRIDAN